MTAGSLLLGKYRLLAKLGHGGMAEVYLAAMEGHAGFVKLCVLKRLHGHLSGDPRLARMFLDEARLAARLNHSNVVATYEIGEDEFGHVLTMEYLEGQPLSRVVRELSKAGRPMPLGVALRIGIDALEGLHYAHTLRDFDGSPLGIVHRDVSPSNLLVTFDGQVKLLDFGIAKAQLNAEVSQTGQVKGKFAYLAPEQARGQAHDLRGDVWSMGIVLWEMLAGKRLFKGPEPAATLRNITDASIPRLDSLRDDIDEELAIAIERALTRDVEQRAGSAKELRDELEGALLRSGLRPNRGDITALMAGLFAEKRDELRGVISDYMDGHITYPRMLAESSESRSGVKTKVSRRRRNPWGALVAALGLAAAFVLAVLVFGTGNRASPQAGTAIATAASAAMSEVAVSSGAAERPASVGSEAEPGGGAEGEIEGRDAVGSDASEDSEQRSRSVISQEATGRSAPQGTATASAGEPEEGAAGRLPGAAMGAISRGGVERPGVPAGANPAGADPTPATRPSRPSSQRSRTRSQDRAGSAEAAYLTIDSVPWAEVWQGERLLGTTPLLRQRLPAGQVRLTLRNPERGLSRNLRVTLRPGESVVRRVDLASDTDR